MFAIGHFAIGYLTGKASANRLKVQLNMPLLLAASVIPDVDLLLGFLQHRGPTHSLIVILVLTVPLLMLYGKAVAPYSVGLASHSLVGDFLTGGIQLFWPFSSQWFGALDIPVNSSTNALLELILFSVSIVIMSKTGDLRRIISDKHKIALLLPFGAVLGPMLPAVGGSEYGHALPILLVIPSLIYLTIFAYSIVIGIHQSSSANRASSTTEQKSQIAQNDSPA